MRAVGDHTGSEAWSFATQGSKAGWPCTNSAHSRALVAARIRSRSGSGVVATAVVGRLISVAETPGEATTATSVPAAAETSGANRRAWSVISSPASWTVTVSSSLSVLIHCADIPPAALEDRVEPQGLVQKKSVPWGPRSPLDDNAGIAHRSPLQSHNTSRLLQPEPPAIQLPPKDSLTKQGPKIEAPVRARMQTLGSWTCLTQKDFVPCSHLLNARDREHIQKVVVLSLLPRPLTARHALRAGA